MSKPREFSFKDYVLGRDLDYLQQLAKELGNKKFIEKSAADKLAEAFESLLKQHRYNVKCMDCEDDKKALAPAEQALKEYRGEK